MEYEEDLSKNLFYLKLKTVHNILLETAAAEKWVICCPRKANINEKNLKSHAYLISHILIPNEDLPKTHFLNLSGKY